MNATDPTATPASRSGFGSSLPLWLGGALLVYVLSTGPAVKLVEHGVIAGSSLETVYAPLVLLANHCEPVSDFFEWYLCEVWDWDIYK